MKVFHINTFDTAGGAARAVERISRGLLNIGVDSRVFVQTKDGDDVRVIGPHSKFGKLFSKLRPYFDRLPLALYKQKEKMPFYLQWLPFGQQRKIERLDLDILHLHWICGGFIRIEELARFKKPIVWTLHDMWAFTGGCHYSAKCQAYINKCGSCPQLHSQRRFDASGWVWKRKNKAWADLDLTLVAPSKWLAECAQKSLLFQGKRIEVISNGLDLARFKPVAKDQARSMLSLSQNKKIILFGALSADSDQRKGYYFILPALQSIRQQEISKNIELVIFGASQPLAAPDFGVTVKYMGRLHDDISLALLYAAADVMLVPSTQEAFGQTASEAMACGCPVVAFKTSGLIDIVDHGINGYLARPFDHIDFAHGIRWVIEDSQRQLKLSQEARRKAVGRFDVQVIAKQYLDLYEDILKK